MCMKRNKSGIFIFALFVLSFGLPKIVSAAVPTATGQRVEANDTLNVRSTPGGSLLGQQSSGDLGTTVDGPTAAYYGGTLYVWWKVNFDSGVDGWVVSIGIDVVNDVSIPSMPTGTNPGSTRSPGPILSSRTVTLDWNSVSGATYYEVGVKDIASGTLVVDDQTTSSKYTVTLAAGREYRWDVAAGNSSGLSGYTDELYFQTPSAVTIPTVVTVAATSVGATSATLNARISSAGGGTITERRFSWGSTSSCADGFTSSVTTSGDNFSYNLSGLVTGRTYYFQAWAFNSAGHNNGSALSFTTTSTTPTTYSISTSSSPSAGGSTSGGGSKASGSSCTVTASANSGYTFVNWTENGSQVSTSSSYAFTVNGNRTLVANFTSNSGDAVRVPGTIPYTRQNGDTPDAFNGAGACGAASAVMIAAYYERLPEHPITVTKFSALPGHPRNYGWYIAPYNGSLATTYSAYGYTYDLLCTDPDLPGNASAYGAYGYIHRPNGSAIAVYARNYFWKHGLYSKFIDLRSLSQSAAESHIRGEIDSGHPVWISTRLLDTTPDDDVGHIVVIHGYDEAGFFCADPMYLGSSVNDGSNVHYTWAELYQKIISTANGKWIVTANPIAPGDQVQVVNLGGSTIAVRSGPSSTATEISPRRSEGEVGTIINDTAKASCFWNDSTYTWLKIRWTDGKEGWSAIGDPASSSSYWLEKIGVASTSYVITLNSDPTAGGATSGGGTKASGTSCTVIASANSGYTFVNWTENGSQVSTSSSYTFTVNGNRTLVANFTANDSTDPSISAFGVSPASVTLGSGFTASYTVSDSGGAGLNRVELWRADIDGSASDPSWKQIGSSISLSGNGPVSGSFPADVAPKVGNYWYGIHVVDGADNLTTERTAGLNPIQRTVNASSYTITASAGSGGSITPNDSFSKPAGSSQQFTAFPDSNYVVNQWKVDGSVVQNGGSSYTLSGIQANHTVQVTFTYIPPSYTISTSSSPTAGGTTSGGGSKTSGSTCTVTASANSGFTFVNWTENGNQVSTSSSYQFTVTGSRALTANFVRNNYTVTFDAQNGTVPNPVSKSVTYGLTYGTLATTARTGYAFEGWWTGANGIGSQVMSATMVTITANQTLYAKWEPIVFKVTVSVAGKGGTVSPDSEQIVGYGGTLTLTATPDSGYKFKHWLVDGEIIGVGQEGLMLEHITTDMTVSAVFEKIKAMPWLQLLLE